MQLRKRKTEDVNFSLTPESNMSEKKRFVDYYDEYWKVSISNKLQPLLKVRKGYWVFDKWKGNQYNGNNREKKTIDKKYGTDPQSPHSPHPHADPAAADPSSSRRPALNPIYLIPELCYATPMQVCFYKQNELVCHSLEILSSFRPRLSSMLELEKRTGIHFSNKSLLFEAFTSPSFSEFVHPYSNQRLEMLGDSVIGLLIVDHLCKILPEDIDMVRMLPTPYSSIFPRGLT